MVWICFPLIHWPLTCRSWWRRWWIWTSSWCERTQTLERRPEPAGPADTPEPLAHHPLPSIILLLCLFLGSHNIKNDGGLFSFFCLFLSGKFRFFFFFINNIILWSKEAFTINAVLLHDIFIVLVRFGFGDFYLRTELLFSAGFSVFPIPGVVREPAPVLCNPVYATSTETFFLLNQRTVWAALRGVMSYFALEIVFHESVFICLKVYSDFKSVLSF